MGSQSIDLLKTPYRGLMPYSEEDAEFFFGREKDWKNIADNLRGSPLTVLYGSSGVGKSSILRAGVAYHLQQEAKQNLEDYGTPEFAVVVFNSWRDDPLDGLIKCVQESVAQTMEWDLDELTKLVQGQIQDHLTLTQNLQMWAKLLSRKGVRGKLFVILDQFEEYFLYHPNEEDEGTFFAEFPCVVNHPDVNFLISLRDDALAQLDRFKTSIPRLFDNYLRLRHLDPKSAHEAIVKPIEKYNSNRKQGVILFLYLLIQGGLYRIALLLLQYLAKIEPDLVKEVIKQVSQVGIRGNGLGGSDKLSPQLEKQLETPYLQLVMTRLWEEEMTRLRKEEKNTNSPWLQLQTLSKLGGAEQIVRDHLNEKMESLSEDQKKAAANAFQYLVTPSGNKIAYPVLDLVELTKLKPEQLENLLEKLSSGRQRILRPVKSSPSQPNVKRYEIFHDVMAQPILDWRKQYLLDEEKQGHKLAIKQGLPAQALRQINLGQDEKAALLARQAYCFYQRERNKVLYQIDDALREALCINNFGNILQGHESEISVISFNPKNPQMLASADHKGIILLWDLRRSPDVCRYKNITHMYEYGTIVSLVFSPDGQMLALGNSKGAVLLWQDLDKPPQILGHHDQDKKVTSVAFNWNGTILASGSDDHTIKIWNLENQSEIKPALKEHKDAVRAVAFSPDANNNYLLASGSKDKSIRLWDISDNSCLGVLENHSDTVRSVAFSPDGQTLASGSSDRTVRLWDVGDLEHLDAETEILEEHKGGVRSVAFSPDGEMLGVGSEDQTVYLWKDNLLDWELTPLNLGHDFGISAVAFSPDSKILASGSWDKTIRLWHLTESEAIPKILGEHDDNIMSVAVSPDGRWLASGSWNKTVRLRDLSQPNAQLEVIGKHEDNVFAVAFNQNSQVLASAGADRKIKLWNLENLKEEPEELEGHKDGVSSVAFSPDGLWLVSGSWKRDATVRLWDLQNRDSNGKVQSKILWQHKDLENGRGKSVTSVAFNQNGKMLASGSDDATIKLLDLHRTKGLSWDSIYEKSSSDSSENSVVKPIVLEDHTGRVWSVAFSPDSLKLASGSDDQTIRLWDLSQELEKPQVFKVLKDHNFWVGSVAFSPDGQKLASGSYDKTIRIWDLKHLDEEPIVLRDNEQSVTSVAFYPDGKKLLSGSYDNTIKEWIVDTEILSNMVCETVQRNLSQKEWKWFMGDDIPYEQTCPNLPPGEGTPEVVQKEEVSELEREFRAKFTELFAGQKYVLDFIRRKTKQQPDISEEDVTNFLNKPKGDDGTYYRLETLRLLGFLEITDRGKAYGTIRYGLSPRYQEYLSKKKANKTS